ncbi:MAG: hypothetical protein OEV78_06600 [Spirochaetia bacterium]|nr:hypothetical protein [Spirochaetia bacterium]
MALNKKKNKKDELKGAIDSELSPNGIMSDFVNNIRNDKDSDKRSSSGKSDESEGFMESIKSLAQKGQKAIKDNDPFSGNFPMIRNRTQKEWWVSLGAFLSVVLLIFLLFFAFGSNNKYQIHLSPNAIDNYTFGTSETKEVFEIGKPVYIYFAAQKAIKTKKIFIKVINLNMSSGDGNISIIESNINPKWKVIETHFQKEFFESPGKYKIIIENEKKKVLIEKTFTVN